MNSTISTALAGITAAQRTLDVTSQNIANARTPGYRRQVAQPAGESVVEVAPTAEPNAALEADLIQQRAASYAYRANLKMLQTQQSLIGTLLDVKI